MVGIALPIRLLGLTCRAYVVVGLVLYQATSTADGLPVILPFRRMSQVAEWKGRPENACHGLDHGHNHCHQQIRIWLRRALRSLVTRPLLLVRRRHSQLCVPFCPLPNRTTTPPPSPPPATPAPTHLCMYLRRIPRQESMPVPCRYLATV